MASILDDLYMDIDNGWYHGNLNEVGRPRPYSKYHPSLLTADDLRKIWKLWGEGGSTAVILRLAAHRNTPTDVLHNITVNHVTVDEAVETQKSFVNSITEMIDKHPNLTPEDTDHVRQIAILQAALA